MASSRPLPELRNPLLEDDQAPSHDVLTKRRRLGQTDLRDQQPGTSGLNSSARRQSLGIFDYAHLRVPLPKDLKGSGIFTASKLSYPESYFLMRRSDDGFISATGMFKAAFPWASTEEEHTERQHHKSMSSAGLEEVAGNVWISPAEALDLADEYSMRRWIVALLDPETIAKGQKDEERGATIASPPKFEVPGTDKDDKPKQPTTLRRRDLRSASPTKATPRKIATPRKRRATKQASVEPESKSTAGTRKVSAARAQESATNGTEKPEGSDTPASAVEVVRVTADETIERENDVEVVHTTVKVEMPSGHPDLPLPEDAEEMVRLAQEMVAQAKLAEGSNSRTSAKRKAHDVEEAEGETDGIIESTHIAKRQKMPLVETLKKERVKSRTAFGLAATIAIGSAISYFL